MTLPRLSNPSSALLFALGMGVSFVFLFFGQNAGLNWPIFVTLLVMGTIAYCHFTRAPLQAAGYIAFSMAALFSLFIAIRASDSLLQLNALAVVSLLLFGCHFGRGTIADVTHSSLSKLGAILPYAAIQTSWVGGPVVRDAITGPKTWSRQQIAAVLRGLALAAPVIIVFTLFLGKADDKFIEAIADVLGTNIIARLLLALFIAWFVLGGLVLLLDNNAARRTLLNHVISEQDQADFQKMQLPRIGFVEMTVVMASIAALFIFFLTLQGEYLFGGYTNIEKLDITLSHHARSGFFELVMVSAMTLGIGLLLREAVELQSFGQRMVFKVLVGVVVVCTIALLFSAQARMVLYEYYYGTTELRFYTRIFILWLGAVLLWFLLGVVFETKRIAWGFALAAYASIMHLNLVNPDAAIAERNLTQFIGNKESSVSLDMPYLAKQLSADAMPVLVQHYNDLNETEQQWVTEKCYGHAGQQARRTSSWRSYHFAYTDVCKDILKP